MPYVGASQPRNLGPPPPITSDLLFVHSEIRFVRGDVAATAQHDARHPPDSGVTGDVKERSIDPVHGLSHLLQHEHMSVEVRLQRRTKQLAQYRHVECRCLLPTADRRLHHLPRPIAHPVERPPNRYVPSSPPHFLTPTA